VAYSDKVMDHYENPRNVGKWEIDDSIGTGMVGAPACGDVMRLQIKVKDNMTLEGASEIKNTDLATELALPPVKIHCSVLAEDAIKSAIADYKSK
jgi:nitrogen fixation NifU-like protein